MLEPREADLSAVFLFLVVLPVVCYILLGKWYEASEKNARISMLAQLAAEEASRVEAMAAVDVIPVCAPPVNARLHACARCSRPATTRCSRCKSVRYCSGKCQIMHWRQVHKKECKQWENVSPNLSDVVNENLKPAFVESDNRDSMANHITSDTSKNPSAHPFHISAAERSTPYKRTCNKFKRESSRLEPGVEESNIGASPSPFASTISADVPLTDAFWSHKFGNSNNAFPDDIYTKHNSYQRSDYDLRDSDYIREKTHKLMEQNPATPDFPPGMTASVHSGDSMINACETEMELSSEQVGFTGRGFSPTSETVDMQPLNEKILAQGEANCVRQMSASRAIPGQDISRDLNMANKKISTGKLPKLSKRSISGLFSDKPKKDKDLFPYEDLVKFFQCEDCDVSPRGLLNCGNSCYANAVLQCLTCTKPLIVYLHHGLHSRTCHVRDWCLMCELERYISMLREGEGPLSPSRILSNMRNVGSQMGGGNQEDAHEFLRLLVTSMQSICLEGIGGEKVSSRLQETTLVQQIFGGYLRSKVTCLKCELESERYENIMDLTLEIHGWVESLEDALTQFTAPEDLDGDNMYRCGRCCAYVRARKELRVHQAPNILTIVLKRFQTGKYGKINKCVTFPDMLDMIPFMTGTSDIPPLYMLYAVIVHLDTSNASFSGHYVSYVKDLRGSWFRIDDSEMHAVTLSQVMSEGAYMLFYSRSFPHPLSCTVKATAVQATNAAKYSMLKTSKPSRHRSTKPGMMVFESIRSTIIGKNDRSETCACIKNQTTNYTTNERRNFLVSMDFSDATSSDWSLFTSSDEASFTTGSTSD